MHILDKSLRGIQRRQRIWAVIHHGRGRLGRTFNVLLSFLIVLSVALLPLEWMERFSLYRDIILATEAVIVGLFTVEYFVRLYAAPRRLKYALSFFGIIDLLSIIPFYAGFFGTEYIRILRFLRFLKLSEVEPSARSDRGRSLERGIGLLPNEEIEYVVTKHPLVLLLGCVPPVIALTAAMTVFTILEWSPVGIAIGVCLIVFALIFFWHSWLDYSFDVIYITNMRLIFQNQHLLGRTVNQVSYPSITNVKPQYAGVFSYVFRYGTLIVDTAAEHPGQIGMKMVRRHEAAAHAIMRQLYAHGTAANLS